MYNNVYLKYYQSYANDVYQWNQRRFIWKLLKQIGFLRKTVIIQWNALKKKQDLLLHANKLIEKIHDPCNTKEYYQSFIRKNPPKSVKQK